MSAFEKLATEIEHQAEMVFDEETGLYYFEDEDARHDRMLFNELDLLELYQ